MPVVEVNDVYPPTTEVVVPYGVGSLRESAVELPDGRVLYVFREADAIRQGYAPDADAFFGTDGSVAGVTDIVTGVSYQSSAVFHDDAGGLFLATCWSGAVKVWRSPSGLGDDWVLHGNVHIDGDAGSESPDQRVVSMPHVAGSVWSLAAPEFTQPFGVGGAHECAYVSTNGGLTWGIALSTGYHILGGIFGQGVGRTLGTHDGKLWWASKSGSSSYGADKLAYSADNGQSWTVFFGTSDTERSFNVSDGTYLYDLRGAGNVYRSSNPTDDTSWGMFRSYALGGGVHDEMVCPVGERWMVSAGGKMVANVGRGWVVGSVTMG